MHALTDTETFDISHRQCRELGCSDPTGSNGMRYYIAYLLRCMSDGVRQTGSRLSATGKSNLILIKLGRRKSRKFRLTGIYYVQYK